MANVAFAQLSTSNGKTGKVH